MKDFKTCMRALRRMSVPVRWRMLVIILIGMVRIGASLLGRETYFLLP